MGAIAFYRVPKTTIPRDMRFRAMVQLDPRRRESLSPKLEITSLEQSGGMSNSFTLDESPPSPSGRYILDIPSEAFLPGAYKAAFVTREESVDVDEVLWVLDREKYDEHMAERMSEAFRPARGLTADHTVELVGRVLEHTLGDERFDYDDGWRFRPHLSWSVGYPERLRRYPDAPVVWAVEHLADYFRYVAYAGTEGWHWHVALDVEEFRISFNVHLPDTFGGKESMEAARDVAARDVLRLSGQEFTVELPSSDDASISASIGFRLDIVDLAE